MNEHVSDTTPQQQTLQVVSFIAGGYRFAVEAARVRSQLPCTQDGTALRVEQLFGLPAGEESENARILVIKHAPADYSMRVSEPVTLSELSLDALHPLPDLLAARCTLKGVRALSTESDGITVLIDLDGVDPDLAV